MVYAIIQEKAFLINGGIGVKKLLIVVDYQKDFVNGSLGFPEAEQLEQPICEKIKQYHQENQDVLFTFDTHQKNYLDTKEGRYLPIVHCIQHTEGWKLFGKVAEEKQEKDAVILKPSFGSLELISFLQRGNYEEKEMVGIFYNIYVNSKAILSKSALPEAEVIVDAHCVASNDSQLNQAALQVMQGLQIQVKNL